VGRLVCRAYPVSGARGFAQLHTCLKHLAMPSAPYGRHHAVTPCLSTTDDCSKVLGVLSHSSTTTCAGVGEHLCNLGIFVWCLGRPVHSAQLVSVSRAVRHTHTNQLTKTSAFRHMAPKTYRSAHTCTSRNVPSFCWCPPTPPFMVKVLDTCEPWNIPWCVGRPVCRAYSLRFRGYNTTRPKQRIVTIRRMSCAPCLDSYVPKLASCGQGLWQASGAVCGSTDAYACTHPNTCMLL
jgi:hypothetical protein